MSWPVLGASRTRGGGHRMLSASLSTSTVAMGWSLLGVACRPKPPPVAPPSLQFPLYQRARSPWCW
ncbi:hypothetical protein PR003_g22361 [Phytophthora rubi]|uniref:Uncharacterized protein n=1 Tax=Phytophthora rubi TaxID=129364 RepID=A0A6A4DAK8_9STRA|nr:hypothetical protein PR003_g22361 [Phytophthora rubi]